MQEAHRAPNCHYEILNSFVDLFHNGRASVFVESDTVMEDDGTRYSKIMEMKWRIAEGRWVLVGFRSMRKSGVV